MIDSLDHLVLTVRDIDATVAFYERVLGMTGLRFKAADGVTRVALSFGQQKINLHLAGRELEPTAAHTLPGSADLCSSEERMVGEESDSKCRSRGSPYSSKTNMTV